MPLSVSSFFLINSSLCGKDLSYYITSYLVHMSFCSSAIATFVVFLVGTNYLEPLTSLSGAASHVNVSHIEDFINSSQYTS